MARLVLVIVAVVIIAGCGGSDPRDVSAADVEAALLERLEAKLLSVRWVRCIESGYQYEGEGVYRCQVNFGTPHIPGYCALLVGDVLVTHFEETELLCARERTPEGVPVG